MKQHYIKTLVLIFLSLVAEIGYTQPCNNSVNYQQTTICESQPYNFYGTNLYTPGTYNDTIVIAGGCDSIISLQLFVIPIVYNNLYDTICQGGSYSFFGTTLTQAGMYGDTLFTGTQFCDSVILLHLAIRTAHNDTVLQTVNFCMTTGGGGGPGNGYNFYGANLTNSGIYYHTITGPVLCQDTVIKLDLHVGRPGGGQPQAVSICQGQSYNFNGQILTAAGVYRDTLISSIGCDSFVTINLTIGTFYKPTADHATFCAGSSYTWHGHVYTQASPQGGGPNAGGYKDTVASTTGGCDSIFTLILTQAGNPLVTVRDSFCYGTSYVYSGHTFTTSGRDSIFLPTTGGGCDTVVVLTLTYRSAPTIVTVDSFCQGTIYHYGADTFSTSGNHAVGTRPAPSGCDTVLVLRLNYKTAPRATYVDSFCRGSIYVYGVDTFTQPGQYRNILVASPNGCDSNITFQLRYKVSPTTPTITRSGSTLIANPVSTSYQWYLNGQAITGATSQALNITQDGVYYLEVASANSCTAVSAKDTVTLTGINDISQVGKFQIYPNPNTGSFTVETRQGSGAEMIVYDVYGRIVLQKTLASNKEIVSMINASAGTYYATLRSDQQVTYAHFVIAR